MSIDKEHNARLQRLMRQRLAASGTERDRLIEIMARTLFERLSPHLNWDRTIELAIEQPFQHRCECLRHAARMLRAAEAAGFLIVPPDDGR